MPAKPRAVFQVSATVTSLTVNAEICVLACWQAVFAAALAWQTLVSWSQIRFVMMFGFKASSCPLLTRGSMAWKVNSVSLRPSSPASNFMVGTQRPKSRPAIVDFCTEDEYAAALEAATAATDVAEVATAAAEVAGLVTVTKVVAAAAQAELAEDTDVSAAAAILAEVAEAIEVLEATPAEPAETLPVVPSSAFSVKLEKPLAAIIWATLKPSALNGVLALLFEFAFSTLEPTTAGSTRGTIPLKTAVVGRVGSEQIDGTLTTKGLKFCSADTTPLAAVIESSPVPNSAMILSASCNLAHGFAAARRTPGTEPANVAAWPGWPPLEYILGNSITFNQRPIEALTR